MPGFVENIRISLETLKYIDYKATLESLNTPYVYVALAVSVFVLFIAYGSYHKHMVHTSMSGAGSGVIVGILLTLAIEAIVVYKLLGTKPIISLFQGKVPDELANLSTGPSVLGDKATTLDDFLKLLPPDKARSLKLSLCQEVIKEIKQ